jgi:hypothetical protein
MNISFVKWCTQINTFLESVCGDCPIGLYHVCWQEIAAQAFLSKVSPFHFHHTLCHYRHTHANKSSSFCILYKHHQRLRYSFMLTLLLQPSLKHSQLELLLISSILIYSNCFLLFSSFSFSFVCKFP